MVHGRQMGGGGVCAPLGLLLAVLALGACSTTKEDRDQYRRPSWPPGSVRTHTVKRGETAWRISQKYDSTVEAIARANGLRDPTKLAIGQQPIKVPVGVKGRSSSSNGSGRYMARDPRGRSPKVVFRWPLRGKLASSYGLGPCGASWLAARAVALTTTGSTSRASRGPRFGLQRLAGWSTPTTRSQATGTWSS